MADVHCEPRPRDPKLVPVASGHAAWRTHRQDVAAASLRESGYLTPVGKQAYRSALIAKYADSNLPNQSCAGGDFTVTVRYAEAPPTRVEGETWNAIALLTLGRKVRDRCLIIEGCQQ